VKLRAEDVSVENVELDRMEARRDRVKHGEKLEATNTASPKRPRCPTFATTSPSRTDVVSVRC